MISGFRLSRGHYAKIAFVISVLFVTFSANAAGEAKANPYEKADQRKQKNKIDKYITSALTEKGIKPANLCSDEVFIRRIYLDVIGTIPTVEEVRNFLKNPRPSKRQTLINILLKRKEYADYWSLKWCDLLRVKAEFPINLWPNAVQAYHRWIRDALASNMSYDQFATELLTSSGSNFRVPQVNFYRAIQGREPSAIATAVALTFMGTRFENFSDLQRSSMEVFFSRVAYKSTAEWKEEVVFLDQTSTEPISAVFPDGSKVRITPQQDPRRVFADWLTTAENPWFAKNIVNRIWSWLMGRGIIDEPDDIRKDNPPTNAELLSYLEKELVSSNYDIRHIFRLILNSRTYQQSSIPQTDSPEAEALFACYLVRQLDAEVLADALCQITGSREKYSSLIPEPFTFIPEENRSIELADGSITSPLLEMFGRPSRDTGLESERTNKPTDQQRLHMLNSSHIQNKIQSSWRLKNLAKTARGKKHMLTNLIYLNILSRYPTDDEKAALEEYSKTDGVTKYQITNDLIWALINSKEFLYRH